MLPNEADDGIRPQVEKRNIEAKKGTKGLFAVIYFMFLMILTLCANNFVIYNSYRDLKKQMDDISKEITSVESEKKALLDEKKAFLEEKKKFSQEKAEFIAWQDEVKKQNEEILKQFEEIKKQNEELVRKNRELTEDNIALQNSLKLAASVGIKPQNYTRFEGLSSRSHLDRGKYIGSFLGTAYTPSKEECGNDKGITNSGKPIIPGVTIAVDNKYWPFGTVFYIKGLGYAVAMDTGSKIKGKYRFDFAVFDKNFAMALGSRKWDVYLVRLGKGSVDDISL